MSKRNRAAFLIFIDLDPRPGSMHSPESAHRWIQQAMNNTLGAYEPDVYRLPENLRIDENDLENPEIVGSTE